MSALIVTSIAPVRRLSITNRNPVGNTDVTNTRIWLTSPAPAGFLRWEGPIVLPEDSIIRVDLISSEKADRQRRWEVRRRRALFASQTSRQAISIASMDDVKFSSMLVFFVGNYFVTCFVIGLVAAVISLAKKPKPLRTSEVSEALFSSYLLFAVGINNLINFVFHVFFGDIAAKFIGWENSPFQAEVGFASLGVGIAGVIVFKASLPFRFATLIPPWAFSLGAAGGHVYQMIAAHNFSPGNVGLVLPIDILMPFIGFAFLWLSYKHPQPETANRKLT